MELNPTNCCLPWGPLTILVFNHFNFPRDFAHVTYCNPIYIFSVAVSGFTGKAQYLIVKVKCFNAVNQVSSYLIHDRFINLTVIFFNLCTLKNIYKKIV